MTSGIVGSGPYTKLKDLRIAAEAYRRELELIAQGHKRQYAASTYTKMLKYAKERIKAINEEIKAAKSADRK